MDRKDRSRRRSRETKNGAQTIQANMEVQELCCEPVLMSQGYHLKSNQMSKSSNVYQNLDSNQFKRKPSIQKDDYNIIASQASQNAETNQSDQKSLLQELELNERVLSQSKYRFRMLPNNTPSSGAVTSMSGFQIPQDSTTQMLPHQEYQNEPYIKSKRTKKHKKQKKERKHRKRDKSQSSSSIYDNSCRENQNPQVQSKVLDYYTKDPVYGQAMGQQLSQASYLTNVIEHLPNSNYIPSVQTQKQVAKQQHMQSQSSSNYVVQPFQNNVFSQHVSQDTSHRSSRRSKHRDRQQTNAGDYNDEKRKQKKHKRKKDKEQRSTSRKKQPDYHKEAANTNLQIQDPREYLYIQPRSISVTNKPILVYKDLAKQQEQVINKQIMHIKEIKQNLNELQNQAQKQSLVTNHNKLFSEQTITPCPSMADPRRPDPRGFQQKKEIEANLQRESSAQRYLNWLERNAPQEFKMRNEALPDPKSLDLKRNKSVENVKQYCIQKLLGRLDTKRELQRISQTSIDKNAASIQVQEKYNKALKDNLDKRQKPQYRDTHSYNDKDNRDEFSEQHSQMQSSVQASSMQHTQSVQASSMHQTQAAQAPHNITLRKQLKPPLYDYKTAPKLSQIITNAGKEQKSHDNHKQRQFSFAPQDTASSQKLSPQKVSARKITHKRASSKINRVSSHNRNEDHQFIHESNEEMYMKPDFQLKPEHRSYTNLTSNMTSARPESNQDFVNHSSVASSNLVYQNDHASSYYTLGQAQDLRPYQYDQRSPQNHQIHERREQLFQESHEQRFELQREEQKQTKFDNTLTYQTQEIKRVATAQSRECRTREAQKPVKLQHDEYRTSEAAEKDDTTYFSISTQKRIDQLKKQAAEIQKLPADFNERVARLKERTRQITNQHSHSRSRSRETLPNQIFVPDDQYNPKRFVRQSPIEEEQSMSEQNDSVSFVRQHDISSSFLQDLQWQQTTKDKEAKLDSSNFEFVKVEKQNPQSRNQEDKNLFQKQIAYQERTAVTSQAEVEPSSDEKEAHVEVVRVQEEVSMHKSSVSQSIETINSKHERRAHKKLRKERRRMLRKIKEKGVYIPPEIEEQIEQSMLNSQSELTSFSQRQSIQPLSDQSAPFLKRDKFSSTRKELIYLQHIQNEHGLLLKAIQEEGLQNIGKDQSQKFDGTNLMMQMQVIFSHLAEIQNKLEQRSIEHQDEDHSPFFDEKENHGSYTMTNQEPSNENLGQASSAYLPQRIEVCTKKDDKNSFQQKTENQLDAALHTQLFRNAYSKQNGISTQKINVDRSIKENHYGLKENTDQTGSHSDMTLKGRHKRQQHDVYHQNETQFSENEQPLNSILGPIIVTDYQDRTFENRNFGSQNSNQFKTNSSNETKGETKMTDVFCQILSQEIEKIQKESVAQVNSMRQHYQTELQALRAEFFAKEAELKQRQQPDNNLSIAQPIAYEAKTSEQLIRAESNHEQTIRETLIKTYSPQKIEENRKSEPRISASLRSPRNDSMRESQTLLNQLQLVKAERDLYFNKLVTVKQKLDSSSITRSTPSYQQTVRTSEPSIQTRKDARAATYININPFTKDTVSVDSIENRQYRQQKLESTIKQAGSLNSSSIQSVNERNQREYAFQPQHQQLKQEISFNQFQYLQEDPILNYYPQSHPSSKRSPDPHIGETNFPAGVFRLQQQREPEEYRQPQTFETYTHDERDDEGGSVEKSMISQEVFFDQISQRHLNHTQFRRPSEEKTTPIRLRSECSEERRNLSTRRKKQDAISTVMSHGFSCVVVDQTVLSGSQTKQSQVRQSKLNKALMWKCKNCKPKDATSGRSRSNSKSQRSQNKSKSPGRTYQSSDRCTGCGKETTPRLTQRREQLDHIQQNFNRQTNTSPIMTDFKPSKSPARQKHFSHQEKPAARVSQRIRNQNSRLRSVQNYFNETQTLGQTSQIAQDISSDQKLAQQFHRDEYESRQDKFEPTLVSIQSLNASRTMGNTLSTQNLALTLKEKEIEERISRIEHFLRQQV